MALVLKDRVRVTSTTAGTGTFTLDSAATGYQDFSVIGIGNTTYYTIADQSGSNWEVGLGTYTAPNQLARTTVYESSNSNNLVNFGSGTKDVFVTLPAEGFASPPAIGGTTPNTITGTNITAYDDGVSNTGRFVLDSYNSSGYATVIDASGIYNDDGTGFTYPTHFPAGLTVAGVQNFYSLYIGVSLTIGSLANLTFNTSSNAINIAAPTTSAPYTLKLPNSAGSNNQVLKTDGSGNLDWIYPAGQGAAPRTITAATDTVGATDVFLIANRAGTVTLTLPTASTNSGKIITVKTIQAQTVVSATSNVVPLAGGAAGTAILAATAGKFAQLVSDGTNWITMQAN